MKCLHLIKPKNIFIKCTYMYFLVHAITCNYSVSIKKIEKKRKKTKSQTQRHLVISRVFVLYFIFAPISSILFNSFLQLLLHLLSVLFLIQDVDQLFHYLRLHSLYVQKYGLSAYLDRSLVELWYLGRSELT